MSYHTAPLDYAPEVDAFSVDDEAEAWAACWAQGPSGDRHPLDWLDTMEDWRERIEAARASKLEGSSDEFEPVGKAEFEPEGAPESDEPVVSAWMGPELQKLQAAYDCGEVPEEECEEYARVLADLWACELEDQRVRAEGYVWNEELGEYLHPDDAHPPFETHNADTRELLVDVHRPFSDIDPPLSPAIHHLSASYIPPRSYYPRPALAKHGGLTPQAPSYRYRSRRAVQPRKTTPQNRPRALR
ncbi:hypothetical protein B0H19DRAFT_1275052 [Mycena capillaripes]|nr:hypothetical protein B0H19DRAFT_1275052 [Mycena capillaripes]